MKQLLLNHICQHTQQYTVVPHDIIKINMDTDNAESGGLTN